MDLKGFLIFVSGLAAVVFSLPYLYGLQGTAYLSAVGLILLVTILYPTIGVLFTFVGAFLAKKVRIA